MFHENLESASRVLGLGQESGAPPPVLFGAIGNWARGTCVTATISSCPANRSGIRPQHSTAPKQKRKQQVAVVLHARDGVVEPHSALARDRMRMRSPSRGGGPRPRPGLLLKVYKIDNIVFLF